MDVCNGSVPLKKVRTREFNGLGFLEIWKKLYMQYYISDSYLVSRDVQWVTWIMLRIAIYCDLGYVSPYACCLEGLRSMGSLHLNWIELFKIDLQLGLCVKLAKVFRILKYSSCGSIHTLLILCTLYFVWCKYITYKM